MPYYGQPSRASPELICTLFSSEKRDVGEGVIMRDAYAAGDVTTLGTWHNVSTDDDEWEGIPNRKGS